MPYDRLSELTPVGTAIRGTMETLSERRKSDLCKKRSCIPKHPTLDRRIARH